MSPAIKIIVSLLFFLIGISSCAEHEVEGPASDEEIEAPKYLDYSEIKAYFDPEYIAFIDSKLGGYEIDYKSYFDKISYFGYIVRDCALIYHFTGEDKFKKICVEIVRYIKENYTVDGFLLPKTTNGYWNRDIFARTLRLYYEAYEYTCETEILTIIDNQIAEWIAHVPRKYHNGYNIFPYGLDPQKQPLDYEIDPNQNLVIAWLFSSVYFCKESRFFKDELLQNIVYEETNAAISLTTAAGELPLCERYVNCYDSNYGGYSATILYCVAQLWGNRQWIDVIKRWGNWLYTSFPVNHPWNTKEDWPNWVKDRHYASNLAERIPAFYLSGVSKQYNWNWVSNIIQLFPDYDRYLYLKFYGLKTIPTSYLKSSYKNLYGFDNPTVTEVDKTLRVIWRNVESIKIRNAIYSCHNKHSISISLRQGEKIAIKEGITNRVSDYYVTGEVEKIVIVDYSHPMQ